MSSEHGRADQTATNSGTEVSTADSSRLRPGPLLFTNVKKVDSLEQENE